MCKLIQESVLLWVVVDCGMAFLSHTQVSVRKPAAANELGSSRFYFKFIINEERIDVGK